MEIYLSVDYLIQTEMCQTKSRYTNWNEIGIIQACSVCAMVVVLLYLQLNRSWSEKYASSLKNSVCFKFSWFLLR